MFLRRTFLLVPTILIAGFFAASQSQLPSVFKTRVDLVEVSFVVTDDAGKYISGLRSSDLRVLDDGHLQNIRSFQDASTAAPDDEKAAASIYVLFDTSSSSYSSFPQTEDAIAGFIRGTLPRDRIAITAFSRNIFRLSPPSTDRYLALGNLRQAIAGDDPALYNAVLLTILDAARKPGRKTIVVFSNGPDEASVLSPDDVGRVAEREGVPIYVFSRGKSNAVSMEAIQSITQRTGGQVYMARSHGEQDTAFNAVRNDLAHSYLLTYSPVNSPNRGFHKIDLELPSQLHYRVRARSGYSVE